MDRVLTIFSACIGTAKWRQQTRTGFPEWSLVCQRSEPTRPASGIWLSPKNHVRHTGNCSGKPLLVCCHHRGFCLELTAVASSSRNTAGKHLLIVGIHYRDTVNMHMCPFPIVTTLTKTKSSRRSKLLPVLTKPHTVNLVDEHIGGPPGGLLLRTTRHIHGTHSNFGQSSPLGGWSAFMFFCFFMDALRPYICLLCGLRGLVFLNLCSFWL